MKAYRIFIFVVSLVVIIGCSEHNKASRIQFLDFQTREALLYATAEGADEGVRLSLWHSSGIYALDKNTVFLFGGLLTPAVSIRSFLLRSEDGGKNWKEEMTPVCGSEVIKVLFVGNMGWALVAQTSEGPGKLTLYSSKDYGKSWKKVSDIPKRHYVGWPKSFEFFDEKNGRMEMLYDGAAPTDGFTVMATSDGGRTWREISNLSLDEYKERYEKNREPGNPPVDYVSGKDSSQWKLQKQFEQISVLRRLL